MKKDLEVSVRNKDWSINLEDEYYSDHPEELWKASVDAVRQTGRGCYVNLVTPGMLGHPEEWYLEPLRIRLEGEGISYSTIQYISECGCGGYVTRVTR